MGSSPPKEKFIRKNTDLTDLSLAQRKDLGILQT